MASNTKFDSIESREKKVSYFRQIRNEFKYISWTSKDELFLSTKIVLVSILIFGLMIYFADVSLHFIFSSIGNIAKLIFG